MEHDTVAAPAMTAPRRAATRKLAMRDLGGALAAGWGDFRACPKYGLGFAAIYVAAGLVLAYMLARSWNLAWLVPLAAGFPLVAPFIAAGIYEVSRRREAGLPTDWGSVLSALRGGDDDQLLMMGGFVFVGFTFWIIIAHAIFAIFLGEVPFAMQSLDIFATPTGIAMLVVGGAAGAVIAFVFYAVTVISLPMLVDREVDFLTAIFVSLAVVRDNPAVMLAWAALLAGGLFVAMVPLFLGLLVVLPVLGHATWHLYRRAVAPAD